MVTAALRRARDPSGGAAEPWTTYASPALHSPRARPRSALDGVQRPERLLRSRRIRILGRDEPRRRASGGWMVAAAPVVVTPWRSKNRTGRRAGAQLAWPQGFRLEKGPENRGSVSTRGASPEGAPAGLPAAVSPADSAQHAQRALRSSGKPGLGRLGQIPPPGVFFHRHLSRHTLRGIGIVREAGARGAVTLGRSAGPSTYGRGPDGLPGQGPTGELAA